MLSIPMSFTRVRQCISRESNHVISSTIQLLLMVALATTLSLAARVNAQENTSVTGANTTNASANTNNKCEPSETVSSPSEYSPQVKAAFITGIGPILIALASFLWGLRQKRNANTANEKVNHVQAAAKDLGERLMQRFVYKTRVVSYRVDIKDLDGTLEVKCNWNEINIIKPGTTLAYITGEAWYSPPDCEITEPPRLVRQSFSRALNLNVISGTPNSYQYHLEITGSLTDSDILSYEYEAKVKKGMFMTKEEVDKYGSDRFKKEYWGHYIGSVVDELILYVTFPDNYVVEPFYGACVGEVLSESLMHTGEIQRIQMGGWFEKGSNWAQLKVREPLVGFSYLIYWVPPSKKFVDALRQTTV